LTIRDTVDGWTPVCAASSFKVIGIGVEVV
jgi:hypothetical protein